MKQTAMHSIKRCSICLTVWMLSALAAAVVPWPQRTVRIVVPISVGTGVDIAARLFLARLAERWKQPAVVENRPARTDSSGRWHSPPRVIAE